MARFFVLITLISSGTSFGFSLPGQPKPDKPQAEGKKSKPTLSPEVLKAQLEQGAEVAREKQTAWAATDSALPERPEARGSILRLELKGGITQSTSEYVLQGIQTAKE